MLGGGMRQSGILAAAGIYALEHNVDRLADDHQHAEQLWAGLTAQGWQAEKPNTNMVYLTVNDAASLAEDLMAEGVRCIPIAKDRIRLVTHLDVGQGDIAQALSSFERLRSKQ